MPIRKKSGNLSYASRTNRSPNLGQKTRPYNNQRQKKKRICKIVDFSVPVDHRINLRECEKKDKYRDLARELKKLWNIKVTIVPIVIGTFGTISSSSSYRAGSTDIPDPLSPLLPIVHRPRQVFRTTTCILT